MDPMKKSFVGNPSPTPRTKSAHSVLVLGEQHRSMPVYTPSLSWGSSPLHCFVPRPVSQVTLPGKRVGCIKAAWGQKWTRF